MLGRSSDREVLEVYAISIMIKSHRDHQRARSAKAMCYREPQASGTKREVTPGVFEKLDSRRPLLDVCDEPERRCPVLVIYSVLI